MPGVFNDDFIPYINQIITPILKVSYIKNTYILSLNLPLVIINNG